MNFKKIDIKSWDRCEYYLFYKDISPCTYSATIELDITQFKLKLSKLNKKFYPSFIYILSKTVNSYGEFRMNVNEENDLVQYDYLNPSYTIFHADSKTFSSIYTKFDENFDVFYNSFEQDMEKYKDIKKMNPKGLCENCFNISALANLDFTSFSLNIKNHYNYLLPIFTIGKFKKENEKLLMPISIQVHHSVIDGFHLSRFCDKLRENIFYF